MRNPSKTYPGLDLFCGCISPLPLPFGALHSVFAASRGVLSDPHLTFWNPMVKRKKECSKKKKKNAAVCFSTVKSAALVNILVGDSSGTYEEVLDFQWQFHFMELLTKWNLERWPWHTCHYVTSHNELNLLQFGCVSPEHTGADSSCAFWVTVPLGVRLWRPSAVSTQLAVETETLLPAAPESFCRSSAVTGEMLREPGAVQPARLYLSTCQLL